jgi:hypothetical protein
MDRISSELASSRGDMESLKLKCDGAMSRKKVLEVRGEGGEPGQAQRRVIDYTFVRGILLVRPKSSSLTTTTLPS